MAATNSSVRQKLIALLALLPLLTGLVIGLGFNQAAQNSINGEQAAYGQSTAVQVADHLADYVIEGDILSLNVISSRLTRETSLVFVAVYDDNNRLVAQSGKAPRGTETYAADITFQDSLVGGVRVAVTHSSYHPGPVVVAFVVVYLLYLAMLVWFMPVIEGWLFSVTGSAASTDTEDRPRETDDALMPEILHGPRQECILVIRIRPARHLESHFDKFHQAAILYGGIVEQTTTEELVIHFDSQDAMYMATCTGLLIQQIARRINSNISFGGTLDLLGDEPDKVRKSASYLASIAEGDLIFAANDPGISDRVELQSFRHALVDADNLSRIAGLINQELLDSQANHLVMQG